MAINWDEIYKQKWKELAGGYEKREADLNAAKQNELAALNKTLEQNRSELSAQRDEALRQAYVSQMNAYKELPEKMNRLGVSGGITESAAADILRIYQNARNSASSDYSSGESKLNSDYQNNKLSLDNRYLKLFSELADAKNKDVWDQTKFAYDAAMEEAAALEDRRRWEAQQAFEEARQQELIRQFNEEMAFKQEQAAYDRLSAGLSSSGSRRSSGSKSSGSKKSASKTDTAKLAAAKRKKDAAVSALNSKFAGVFRYW